MTCPHARTHAHTHPQGLCESRQLHDFDGGRYWMALVSRRSRLHPGPRYKARGLNDYSEPGNELEVEQVGARARAAGLGGLVLLRYTVYSLLIHLAYLVHVQTS